ncbi:MAG: DNA repair protein RecO [Gammaproteobacteria bacterium]|nr:DNA repair protein RecO [Gammaproteobacteria bacterium]
MENRVYLQPAYILHKQAFQNTSLLIDFFCVDYGRVRAVARGGRRAKSKYRPLLQVFHPLLVSLTGKGEVKTVAAVESSVCAIELVGERLFSGLYLNELITRLLMSNIEHSMLYKNYQNALLELQGTEDINTVLRRFELSFLTELGYGINLEQDCVSTEAVKADNIYLFVPDHGFEQVVAVQESGPSATNIFLGKHIMELRQLKFTDKESRDAAKRILRLALQAHLGGKPLHSRSLFAHRA